MTDGLLRVMTPDSVAGAQRMARLVFEVRFRSKYGLDLPREWAEKWWPETAQVPVSP